MIHKADNTAIGYCGLEVQTIDGEEIRELGYRIAAPYRGRGLTTEAVRAETQARMIGHGPQDYFKYFGL